ncbi:MFS family permease [Bradyrhizobium sp. USDA 4449]
MLVRNREQLRVRVYAKISQRLIPILMLCYLLAVLDRTNVAFGKLQFSKELNFDDAVFGFGSGIFFLGYLLFEVPSNVLLTRIGFRATLLRIMLTWGLCCSALALMSSYWHFYSLRFLLGVAEAGFFPGVLYYLSTWTPAERRARITALFMSSLAVSGIIGSAISVTIMGAMDKVLGLSGWQWLFLLEGLPCIVVAIVAFRMLPNSPDEAVWLEPAERALVTEDLEAERHCTKVIRPIRWNQMLVSVRFLALCIGSIALLSNVGAVFYWLPSILHHAGIVSVLAVGATSILPFAIAACVQYLVARSSDRTWERRYHVAVPLLVSSVGWFASVYFAADVPLCVISMCLATAGVFGATGPFWSLPSLVFTPTSAAVGIAAVSTVGGFGAFVSQPVVGYLSVVTASLQAGQFYVGGVTALGALAVIWVRLESPP